jgi:hypothetical protein
MPYAFDGIYGPEHIKRWKKITKERYPEYYIYNYKFSCNCEPLPCNITQEVEKTCAYIELRKGKEPMCNMM